MIRFHVCDNEGSAKEWPLVNAHLLGPEDLALPGRIRFRNGHIECAAKSGQPLALCLLFDAGPSGNLMLQTCLLPERDEPYLLSLELARHRIKTFIVKSEEWQMFDLAAEHPAMKRWEEARGLFTDAINMNDPLKADRAAQRSLAVAIDSTERLAMSHAEILLHRRYGTRPASNATLGVRVWPERDAQPLRDLVEKEFDLLVLPIRWSKIEIEEGKLRWDRLDRWMQWAQAKGKPVIAGPLLDFSKKSVPRWMHVWQHDYDTVRDLTYDFIEKVVARYRAIVAIWNIASGININDNFEFKPAQMLDLTRMANLLVKQSHKRARTMLELAQPFGEFSAAGADAVPPITFVDQIVQEGIKVDCLGVRLLFGRADDGLAMRDLMQISSLLDRLFLFELPVIISATCVPDSPVSPDGGCWQESWTPRVQANWAARMFAIAMSKPFVESMCWAELYDHDASELPGAGLISDSGKAKPVLNQLIGIRRRMRKPLGALRAESASPESVQESES